METSSPVEADIIVQKTPSDIGIHRNPRKGTLEAPEKILEDYGFDRDVMIDEVFPDEFSLEETQERIEKNTRELVSYGKPVVSLGGDHSVSFPILKALKLENPGMQLVWLDSHLDLKEPVNGHVSHDVVVRELIEKGVFREDEIWFVGVSSIDGDEREFLEDHELKIFEADETGEFLREFNSSEQPIYLSVDIDILQGIQGTGYPDGELSVDTVEEVIEKVEPVHSDIVEVAPPLDKGKTVERAQAILDRLAESSGSR